MESFLSGDMREGQRHYRSLFVRRRGEYGVDFCFDFDQESDPFTLLPVTADLTVHLSPQLDMGVGASVTLVEM